MPVTQERKDYLLKCLSSKRAYERLFSLMEELRQHASGSAHTKILGEQVLFHAWPQRKTYVKRNLAFKQAKKDWGIFQREHKSVLKALSKGSPEIEFYGETYRWRLEDQPNGYKGSYLHSSGESLDRAILLKAPICPTSYTGSRHYPRPDWIEEKEVYYVWINHRRYSATRRRVGLFLLIAILRRLLKSSRDYDFLRPAHDFYMAALILRNTELIYQPSPEE